MCGTLCTVGGASWNPLPTTHTIPLYAAAPPRATPPPPTPRHATPRLTCSGLRMEASPCGGWFSMLNTSTHTLSKGHTRRMASSCAAAARSPQHAGWGWGGGGGEWWGVRWGRGGGHQRLDVDVDIVDGAHAGHVVGEQPRGGDELGEHMAGGDTLRREEGIVDSALVERGAHEGRHELSHALVVRHLLERTRIMPLRGPGAAPGQWAGRAQGGVPPRVCVLESD